MNHYKTSIVTGLLLASSILPLQAQTITADSVIMATPKSFEYLLSIKGTPEFKDLRDLFCGRGINYREDSIKTFIYNANFWQKEVNSLRYATKEKNWELLPEAEQKQYLQELMSEYCEYSNIERNGFHKDLAFDVNSIERAKNLEVYNNIAKTLFLNTGEIKKENPSLRFTISILAHGLTHANDFLNPQFYDYSKMLILNHLIDTPDQLEKNFTKSDIERFKPAELVPGYISEAIQNNDFSVPGCLSEGSKNLFLFKNKNMSAEDNKTLRDLILSDNPLLDIQLKDGILTIPEFEELKNYKNLTIRPTVSKRLQTKPGLKISRNPNL
jgi:hypothetical protein